MIRPDEALAVVDRIGAAHNVGIRDILSRSHIPSHVRARHAAIRAVAEEWPRASLAEIGRLFGRHHATVLIAKRGRRYAGERA